MLWIESHLLGQKFPHPSDLLLLEIVPERPVPEHLEKCRVAIVADFFDISRPETFLRIHDAGAERMRFAQEIGNDRLHARSGKKRRWIIFRNKQS